MSYWQPINKSGSVRSGCLSCPPRPQYLRYDADPSPGFGVLVIRRDGKPVAQTTRGAAVLVRRWRGQARVDPNHEWTIDIDTPMVGIRYTRQPSGRWMATHRSPGFA